jgi:glycosyltransferase involved in cell wall biosynthesis
MRLSVITVNLNNASGLKKTIESVVNQSFRDFEHIIIDGGSTDDSVEVIHSYTSIPPGIYTPLPDLPVITHDVLIDDEATERLRDLETKQPKSQNTEYWLPNTVHCSMPYAPCPKPVVYWISEPDSGIYAAMNKGIKLASGEYVFFLNSGDTFVNSSIVKQLIDCKPSADVVIGKINFISCEGETMNNFELKEKNITLFSLYMYGIPHQASLIRRQLFFEYGFYDESLKFVSDWKFFVQILIIHDRSYEIISTTMVNYDNYGVSTLNMGKLIEERNTEFSKLFPARICADYKKIGDNYYEVYRIEWLFKHRLFYRLYRLLVLIGRKLYRNQ